MKKFKRIIGAALAAAMALSLTVTPVFAAGDTADVPGEGIITWGVKTASANPEVNKVDKTDTVVTGNGDDRDNNSATENVPYSKIEVVLPNNQGTLTTTVDEHGNWSVTIPTGTVLNDGDKIKVYQTEPGKAISSATVVTVGSGEPGEPDPPITPVDPTKFLSMSFPSKFYWYVYQANPGKVESPVHKVVNKGISFVTADGDDAVADPQVKVSLKTFVQTNTLAKTLEDKLVLNFNGDFATNLGSVDLAKDYSTLTELGTIKSNITTASKNLPTPNKDTLTFGFTGTYSDGLPSEKLVPTYNMVLHYEVVGTTDIEVLP